MKSPVRCFEAAVEILNSSISQKLKPPQKAGPSTAQGTNVDAMAEGLKKVGITQTDLKKLNVIHIAGTKGKGSTSSMCEKILREHGYRTAMFTSPHLVSITERIQIAGQPISNEKFTEVFFDVLDALGGESNSDDDATAPPKATFFRLLTLVALKCFITSQVDVAILEVGLGGRLDCTNAVMEPVVTGCTHIGYDHVMVLGNTLTLIASEKAGIAKPNIPFLISPEQDQEALDSLINTATGRKALVSQCQPIPAEVKVGLQGDHQRINASLALALCDTWLKKMHNKSVYISEGGSLSPTTASALANVRWPGRCQILKISENVRILIDGGHTDKSIEAAFKWYTTARDTNTQRYLLFFCHEGREPKSLLAPLSGFEWERVIFTPLVSSKSSLEWGKDMPAESEMEWVRSQHKDWSSLSSISSEVAASLPSVIKELREVNTPVDVFAVGSLYLAGDIIRYCKEHDLAV
eukprot:TRINITY_DN4544_c0_g3_i2.p1 TRINITY_DN4544_c0_g3~~TRINITY_DN4544_c0_g3_i2.p1  ORF type:complete len:485 (+),score=73.80 TRINITY_DN4544_c0_g3_i2:60-1457(+)